MTAVPIAFVAAVARNGVIGEGGRLPWHIASDLKRFKAITLGKPVIMGRKTWESLPRKPLPGRTNIVLTRHENYHAEGAAVVTSLDAALAAAAKTGASEICVIGGGELFGALMARASRLYLSEVDLRPSGDTLFPAINPLDWHETSRETFDPGPQDDAGFTLRVLDRINPVPHS
jgi:dihydrofolate reductase